MFKLSARIRKLLVGIGLGIAALSALPMTGLHSPAQAQYIVAAEFREALSPHGRWVTHGQWGEVWLPDPVPAGWRPYTRGRWVYTNEWGWYWQEADEEAAWGWVANHYGRWVHDADLGWLWVPGYEWAPAWVDWRYSDDYVGWAPLPPAGVIVAYQDDPLYWSFVRPRYLLAPRVLAFLAPPHERVTIIRRTIIVDRHRHEHRHGPKHANPHTRFNAGIEPGVIARATGKPIRAVKIEPGVMSGTKVQGTREIDVKKGEAPRTTIRHTNVVVRHAERDVRPPQMGTPGDRPVHRLQAPPLNRDRANHTVRGARPLVPGQARAQVIRSNAGPPSPTMRRSSPPSAPMVTRRVSPPPSFAIMQQRRNDGGGSQFNRRQANDDRRQIR